MNERLAGIAGPLMPGHVSHGRLEDVLRSGEFAVTAELNPPDSADPTDFYHRARFFDGWADAVNVTDGAGGTCHMSSLAASVLSMDAGLSPIMQMTCRDSNRIGLQANILGAAALGISSILCLRGDSIRADDNPGAKAVFDLETLDLIETARIMRDNGRFPGGKALLSSPRLFIGATANPFAEDIDSEIGRLAKKIDAGANFIQTQFCFDVPRLRMFMRHVEDKGLFGRCFVLVGVGPLRSAKSARWMRERLFGVSIPDGLIARLEGAADQAQEGRMHCVETIQELQVVRGVSGIHLMAPMQEEVASELVGRSGVLKARRGHAPSERRRRQGMT